MKRILIVGSCGSGKSTSAYKLSAKSGISHIELDDLFWLPDWKNIGKVTLSHIVQEKIDSSYSWIISGNYSEVQPVILAKADTVIWLDYSFLIIFSRLLYRTLKRILGKEECCNGNYETFYKTLFSKESIIFWMLCNFHLIKRKYTVMKSNLRDSDLSYSFKKSLDLS
jgi:adenylate kinase family enzyme